MGAPFSTNLFLNGWDRVLNTAHIIDSMWVCLKIESKKIQCCIIMFLFKWQLTSVYPIFRQTQKCSMNNNQKENILSIVAKSCTTLDVWNPIHNGTYAVSQLCRISQPSTVWKSRCFPSPADLKKRGRKGFWGDCEDCSTGICENVWHHGFCKVVPSSLAELFVLFSWFPVPGRYIVLIAGFID